ncbi:MAG: SMI1/KNR4 family protein [Pirellulaceae bacterium]
MTNWLDLLTRHHAVAQADSDYEPLFGDPASPDRLEEVEAEIGLALPAELKDLYLSVDGYGVRMDEESTLSLWFIVPSSALPSFVANQREGFAGTHKSLSERFLPFIDWANGDSMGYLFDRDGKLLDGLYKFMHGQYGYEADQDPDEFFDWFESSIAEFMDPKSYG